MNKENWVYQPLGGGKVTKKYVQFVAGEKIKLRLFQPHMSFGIGQSVELKAFSIALESEHDKKCFIPNDQPALENQRDSQEHTPTESMGASFAGFTASNPAYFEHTGGKSSIDLYKWTIVFEDKSRQDTQADGNATISLGNLKLYIPKKDRYKFARTDYCR